METYKDIKNYEGLYQISNLGNVKSLTRVVKKNIKNKCKTVSETITIHGRIKKQSKTIKGNYITYWVVLSKNGKHKKFYVHRLVAEHFIKNVYNKKEVNHKDSNPQNNKADNLEWVTHNENMKHAMVKNRISKGESSGMSKLNNNAIKEIYNTKTDAKLLAIKYNVSRESIYSIRRGQSWKHITKNL